MDLNVITTFESAHLALTLFWLTIWLSLSIIFIYFFILIKEIYTYKIKFCTNFSYKVLTTIYHTILHTNSQKLHKKKCYRDQRANAHVNCLIKKVINLLDTCTLSIT